MCHHVFSTFSKEILFRHDIVRITLTMEQAKVRACGDVNYEAISEAISETYESYETYETYQPVPTSSNIFQPVEAWWWNLTNSSAKMKDMPGHNWTSVGLWEFHRAAR